MDQFYTNENTTDTSTDLLIGCESLNFLPEPLRVLSADRGFDYNYGGVGKKESKVKRALYTIPLFIVMVDSIKNTPFFPLLTGEAARLWNQNYFNPYLYSIPIGGVQLRYFVSVLSDYDNRKLQAMVYASTLLPLLAIWWVESIRRANSFTFSEFA